MIKVIGIDAAFANMGLARAYIDTDRIHSIEAMQLVTTSTQDKKVVRKSSDDLRRAAELHGALQEFSRHNVTLAFAEVPSGSQSASAGRALGIAVGVLASCPVPIIEVSPMEVKKLFSPNGKRKVSKREIIDWAVALYPNATWKRVAKRVTNDNEHLADAIAVIHAGMLTPEFKQLVAMASPKVQRRAITK